MFGLVDTALVRMVHALSGDLAAHYELYLEVLAIEICRRDNLELHYDFALRRDHLTRSDVIAPRIDPHLAEDEQVVILRLFAQLEDIINIAIAADHTATH